MVGKGPPLPFRLSLRTMLQPIPCIYAFFQIYCTGQEYGYTGGPRSVAAAPFCNPCGHVRGLPGLKVEPDAAETGHDRDSFEKKNQMGCHLVLSDACHYM